ncbi:hypothetical protein [Thalassobacillus sp. B23F22_16]|uniref:hypothetical protein n=1 Tax=Thalassobacillus sp. B23F22_16 TaxID=3459513 RepID=UPI00373E0B07
MKKVFEKNGLIYYEYNPSITKPFYKDLEPLTLKRRVRLLLAYLTGYKVFYIADKNNLIGYCLVQNGKDKRYKFSTKKDIIVGPYFVHEDYRGRKLSIVLLDYILNTSGIEFKFAYDYIHKDNIPSIKASEAVGFQYLSDAHITKLLRSIKLCDKGKGDYIILKFSKS